MADIPTMTESEYNAQVSGGTPQLSVADWTKQYGDPNTGQLPDSQIPTMTESEFNQQNKLGFGETLTGGGLDLLNKLTFGGGDELVAGGSTLASKLSNALMGTNLPDTYDERLAQTRDLQNRYATEHPYASMFNNVGAFLMPIPGGAITKEGAATIATGGQAARVLPQLAMSAEKGFIPAITNVGKAATFGGGLGATSGFLSGEGTDARLQSALYGGGAGAVGGAVLQGGVEGLTGGASKLMKFLGPQTQEGALAEVGKVASPYVQGLDAALKAEKKTPLGAMKTTAEVVQSPELAMFEQQMAGMEGTAPVAAKAQQARKESQNWIAEQVSAAKDIPKEDTGNILKSAFQTAKDAGKKVVTDLYDAVPQGTKAGIVNTKGAITKAKNMYYGAGNTRAIPTELKKVLDYIYNPKNQNQLTIQELQNLRSTARDLAKPSFIAKNSKAEALAASVADALASTIERAPKGAKQWRLANDAYREYAQTFKSGPLRKLADMDASKIPRAVLSTPESAAQFNKAVESVPGAKEAIKDHIAAAFAELTDAGKVGFVKNNKSQLKTLLGGDFTYLESVANNIKSRTDTQKLANISQGSNTQLKLSSVMERALTGKDATKVDGLWSTLVKSAGKSLPAGLTGAAVVTNPMIAIPAAAVAYGGKVLRDRSTELVQKTFHDALLNPQTMQKAVKAAKTAALVASKPQAAISTAQVNQAIVGSVLNESRKPSKQNFIDTAMNKAEAKMEGKKLSPPVVIDARRVNTESPEQLSKVVDSMITQESSGKVDVVSKKGAKGLMQLMDATGKELFSKYKEILPTDIAKKYDPFNATQNKILGTMYIKELLDKYDGDLELALTAYNQGMGNVDNLMKIHGKSLADIKPHLGPDGKKYASQIINRIKKSNGSVKV